MKTNPEKLYALLRSLDGIAWEADSEIRQFTFISNEKAPVLGCSPQEWLNRPGLWESCIHPDDKAIVNQYRELSKSAAESAVFNYRMIGADEQIAWIKDAVSVIREDGKTTLRGIMLDVTTAERLRALEHLERNILQMNADVSIPLTQILKAYLEGLEALFTHMHCSIHLISNHRLAESYSPSLPEGYLQAITGIPIGEDEGSCGAAATLKRQVITANIATDPHWEKYRALAFSYGLHACWSNPVINSDGNVMATLAMYYSEPRTPVADELNVMEKAAALLRIILENRQKTDIIREANLLMLQSQELAHFGNWRWDVVNDTVSWSPELYNIYGLDKDNFKSTFAGYLERLHPDDRERALAIIQNLLHTGKDVEFEERVFRPNGELRHLRSWARLKTDADGKPLEMIGACLDVTERVNQTTAIEQQNEQLREIAWIQSHLVRSPLANIMGLAELLRYTPESDPEKDELLNHLMGSAQELDDKIRYISDRTELLR